MCRASTSLSDKAWSIVRPLLARKSQGMPRERHSTKVCDAPPQCSYSITFEKILTFGAAQDGAACLGRQPMKHLRTTALAGGLALLASATLANGLEGKIIGFSQIGSESGWRAAETAVTRSEAERLGVDLKFADAQQRQENQIRAIRGFIAQGVDAILVAPVVATGWEEVLAEAKEADIPVVLLDRGIDAPEDLYLTAVASDQVEEGRVAGQWLVDTVAGGDCRVVELQGTVGSSPAINRKRGFEEAIAAAANVTIVRSQTGDFTRSKGKEVMEGFLKAENGGRDLCAVYAHNDDMAVGAIQAIKDAGLKPGEDILVVSIDAVPDIFAAMAAGEANATVELTPNMAGPAFEALDAFFNAGVTPPKHITTVSTLYTPDDDPTGEYEARKGLGY
jgi:ABC-type sugar transport system substrate-binding protein